MSQSQNLHLDQRITTRLSQQQLRFVKLLELNAPELDEAVTRELEDNPALGVEEDAPENEAVTLTPASDGTLVASARQPAPAESATHWKYAPEGDGNQSQITEFAPRDDSENLYDYLSAQLNVRNISPEVAQTAEYIIGSLDRNGYLRRPLASLLDDMAFGPGIDVTMDVAEEALKVVQSLEPFGVGATSLNECLLIQLRQMPPSQERDDAIDIITKQFEAFTMKHTHRIISGLKISEERVKDAIALILTLNPKPGASIGGESDTANVIIPDFTVANNEGRLVISLNNSFPSLQIEQSFEEAVKNLGRERRGRKPKGSEFISSRYNEARDFIRILRQRQQTMMDVMTAIVKLQHDYFLTDDVYRLRPMMIKDISALTGYDLSVISRATANKYVATTGGIFPLRFFFSDTIGQEDGTEAITNRKIEAEIAKLVEEEDKSHPLSDENIRKEMAERGFDVSRRTVAKYRDRQGIPVARLRKKL